MSQTLAGGPPPLSSSLGEGATTGPCRPWGPWETEGCEGTETGEPKDSETVRRHVRSSGWSFRWRSFDRTQGQGAGGCLN